jgi:flavin reductase (DIM6/NTAB) family NADH-FMN oxidoreductase RutF
MAATDPYQNLIALDVRRPIWDAFFTVAPLVLIGSRDGDGAYNFAPKHMAMPLGWANYFGFVCSPRHRTYHNIRRVRQFTVSYVRPTQVLMATMAATARDEEGAKAALGALTAFPARGVEGEFLQDATILLACTLERVVDGFGPNSLIVGQVAAAFVTPDAFRDTEGDDQSLLYESPLMAYLHPGRFAAIRESFSFPFPTEFKR